SSTSVPDVVATSEALPVPGRGPDLSSEQFPQVLWKADQYVLVLTFGDVQTKRPRCGPEDLLCPSEVGQVRLSREAGDELVAPKLDGRHARIPALVVETADQHRQLSTKLCRLVDAEPVAQHVQHAAEHVVSLPA